MENEKTGNLLPKVGPRRIGDGLVQTVNARDLHAYLEVGKDFSTWVRERIESYQFVEGQDFVISKDLRSPKSGSPKARAQTAIEYHLSLDMAKEMSMVERTDKGKQARRYFIECERKAKGNDVLPGRESLHDDLGALFGGIAKRQREQIIAAMFSHFERVIAADREIYKKLNRLERELLQVKADQNANKRGLTAGEVVEMAGVTDRRGLRGIARVVSERLKRYHASRNVAVSLARWGLSTAYQFDHALTREWLRSGGKDEILKLVSERRGQGVLKLVSAAKK